MENWQSSLPSVSPLKTVAGVFDPVDGPKETYTNKNANEKKKDPAFNSGKYEGDKAISISNNHFSWDIQYHLELDYEIKEMGQRWQSFNLLRTAILESFSLHVQ